MHNSTKLSLTLILSLTSACSLLKVNGKPLGGGSSATPSSEAEPAAKDDSKGFESREDYEARQQRTYAEQDRKAAADKAGQPAFCADYGMATSKDIKLEPFADIDNPRHDWKLDATDFAEVMCATSGKNFELRPKVIALHAKWMQAHGLDEKDWLLVLGERMGRHGTGQSYATLPGPISQMPETAHDAGYHTLDRLGSRASMLARVSFVERCLNGIDFKQNLLRAVLCTTEPLDAAKGYAEIDATAGLNAHTRFYLRQTVRNTVNGQTAKRGELAKVANEDPGVAKLIAIAEAQHKEWATPSAARTKVIKLVEAMEAATSAGKTSAFAGCEDTTRAAWTDIVKATELPAIDQSEVLATMVAAVFKTPEPYLAYRALELCAAGVDAKISSGTDMFGSAYKRRGARSGAIAAWMAQAGDIKFDTKELKIATLLSLFGSNGGSTGSRVSVGTIDKVVANGARVAVSFKQDIIEVEDCIASKQTNRILRIESNGTVTYAHDCTKWGMVKVDRRPEAVTFSGLVASGLKPGMLFMVTEDGFPIVATASSKSKKAVWLFGVAR
jgi:hypothetical protein